MPTGNILSACREGGLLETRNAVLAEAGFTVHPAVGCVEAITALTNDFDVVIIGHLYSTEEKNLIAGRARELRIPVLVMHSEALPPNVPAASAFTHNLESPAKLIERVRELVVLKRKASA